MNVELYLDFLMFELECFRMTMIQTFLISEDSHFDMDVRNYLNRRIGRLGAGAWPSRSPDVNIDSFRWGYLKKSLYQNSPDNIEDLNARIGYELQMISSGTNSGTLQELYYTLSHCQIVYWTQILLVSYT